MMLPQTIQWLEDESGWLRLLDQTKLPTATEFLDCNTPEQVWQAIRQLSVRGAPAIGVAAAYGVVLATQASSQPARAARMAIQYLATSRPTAVNLFWALDRMQAVVDRYEQSTANATEEALAQQPTLGAILLRQAIAIHDEDRQLCHRIGDYGAPLIESCQAVLTHCNAGSLATSQFGTALGVIYAAHQRNPQLSVYADETRPLWQGARLTAWELSQSGIDVTVICDSMAAHVMQQRKVQAVIVGADRIAANGDTANKIGTYALAIAAKYHGIPFYVAAPYSTFDLGLDDGSQIPIEERTAEEVAVPAGQRMAPEEANVYNPAFDVTPADLITAIITDRGVIQQPTRDTLLSRLRESRASAR